MYMTGDEIRALSRRIPAICNATDEELDFWMDDAFDVINNYCQQDFTFERQVTRQVRASNNTIVTLPKVLSGDITVTDEDGRGLSTPSASTSSSTYPTYGGTSSGFVKGPKGADIEVFAGTNHLGYYQNNIKQPRQAAKLLNVTGDWGFALTSTALLTDSVNEVKAAYEAHRADATVHVAADGVNVITSPDATDFDSSAVLLNELKAVINSHFQDITAHNEADSTEITEPDVTDETSAFVLLADIKSQLNSHFSNTTVHDEADTANEITANTDQYGAVMPRVIRRVFLRLVQRIALRDDPEDIRQLNSPYANETLGDDYTYDLSNGTLRNLMRPEEAHMLLPYVNRGKVVM